MIHRYINWRNNHADDERLRRCRRRPAVWPGGLGQGAGVAGESVDVKAGFPGFEGADWIADA